MTPGTTEYKVLHKWVARKLGRPRLCQHCGSTDAKKFEWANISKEYKREVTDWIRLCTPCHQVFDGHGVKPHELKTHCIRGHPFEGPNLYTQPDGTRRCKACVNMRKRRWRALKTLKGTVA